MNNTPPPLPSQGQAFNQVPPRLYPPRTAETKPSGGLLLTSFLLAAGAIIGFPCFLIAGVEHQGALVILFLFLGLGIHITGAVLGFVAAGKGRGFGIMAGTLNIGIILLTLLLTIIFANT